jgi:hypothetical protein
MSTITTIATECLSGLDVQLGDTLRILAARDNEWIVEIHRNAASEPPCSGSISQWLRSARGSVKLQPGESVDDVRVDYYSKKYGLDR